MNKKIYELFDKYETIGFDNCGDDETGIIVDSETVYDELLNQPFALDFISIKKSKSSRVWKFDAYKDFYYVSEDVCDLSDPNEDRYMIYRKGDAEDFLEDNILEEYRSLEKYQMEEYIRKYVTILKLKKNEYYVEGPMGNEVVSNSPVYVYEDSDYEYQIVAVPNMN